MEFHAIVLFLLIIKILGILDCFSCPSIALISKLYALPSLAGFLSSGYIT